MIQIKNLRTEQPAKPYDIRVDRQSPLGNPFYMKDESKRNDVCDKYTTWLDDAIYMNTISGNNQKVVDELVRLIDIYRQYGKLNLFCWCAPKRCHAETIKEKILNQAFKF